MAETSKIEWTDATWNPVTGCSVVSPGCTNCYAMRLAGTRLKGHPSRAGLTVDSKAGPVWTGEVRLNEQWLDQPLRWSRPRRIFVCAHGDLFHESVPVAWIDRVFAVMAMAPHHTFQVLTKRAVRMRAYMSDPATFDRVVMAMFDLTAAGWPTVKDRCEMHGLTWTTPTCGEDWWPLRNVWKGVSAENQPWLDLRAPHLLETPAAVRFLSAEPLLQPIDLEPYLNPVSKWSNGWLNNYPLDFPGHQLDLVIVGGENGPRPMHPDWVRDIRDDCAAAGVPFFFKQWGTWGPGEVAGPIKGPQEGAHWFDGRWDIQRYTMAEANNLTAETEPAVWRLGKKAAGRLLDGQQHDATPVHT